MPINCSVEMFAAMSEKPISHHGKPRPARKYDSLSAPSFFCPLRLITILMTKTAKINRAKTAPSTAVKLKADKIAFMVVE